MIKKILLVLVLCLVGFFVVAAFQPSEFRISRTTTITAPPAAVFEYCNDLHKWQEWSPWAKLDPNCTITYEGPATGVGSSFKWSGNNEVGEGKMTIIESKPNELVRNKLEFIKPFEATSTVDFALKPEGANTQLSWTMNGTNGFMGKCISLVMNCDKMMGTEFEKGFANLKSVLRDKSGAASVDEPTPPPEKAR